jgi:hypothetical protein
MTKHPPRLAHLATRQVLVAKLTPTYAAAHHLDEDEAMQRLDRALRTHLLDRLLDATWTALLGKTKRLSEEGLLEKVAGSMKDRPFRPGRVREVTPGWSAFMLLADIAADTASDAARKLLETEEGKRRTEAGLVEVAQFVADELTRK